jgi:hypothetical protein
VGFGVHAACPPANFDVRNRTAANLALAGDSIK